MMDYNGLATSEIVGAYFTLLTNDELDSLNKVTVDATIPFKANGPTPNGVHDPALGTNDGRNKCSTCHFTSDCNGHLGIIEFPYPLYHPLFQSDLIKLLKLMCFDCCRFRVPKKTIKQYIIKFKLLRRGLISHFTHYDILTNVAKQPHLSALDDTADERLTRIKYYRKLSKTPKKSKNSSSILHLYNETRERFFSLKSIHKCQHCKAFPPSNISSSKDKTTISILWGNSLDYISKYHNRKPEDKSHVLAHELAPFIQLLFQNHENLLKHLFPLMAKSGFSSFFMNKMCITPNKFRLYIPVERKNKVSLHSRTASYLTIIKCIKDIQKEGSTNSVYAKINKLQLALNSFVDSGYSSASGKDSFISSNRPGIKQLIEHKTGLLRNNMMGKRVNYSARSVIAPDCFLNTNEVGVPLNIATSLDFPERVTRFNIKFLRKLVENGPFIYPGATYLKQGKVLFHLGRLSPTARKAKAKSLNFEFPNQTIVYRHLLQGDVVLMNRQPTLHRPGIMAHFVRVCLEQKTLRLNYVNCNTYNADFDGDEMNLHVPQDHLARAEAELLLDANAQYEGPKDGIPIRGLIQDHCQGGAMLTLRDTFLTKSQFNDLAFEALYSAFTHNTINIYDEMNNTEKLYLSHNNIQIDWRLWRDISKIYNRSEASSLYDKMNIVIKVDPPAIIYPVRLWTGKQLITCIFKSLIDAIAVHKLKDAEYNGINFTGNSNPCYFDDSVVVMQNSELLSGVLDKTQLGATCYSLSHIVNQLLGPSACGALLSSFSRLFTTFLRSYGATCSISDFIIDSETESKRNGLINSLTLNGLYLQSLFSNYLTENQAPPDSKRPRISIEEGISLSKRRASADFSTPSPRDKRDSNEIARREVGEPGFFYPGLLTLKNMQLKTIIYNPNLKSSLDTFFNKYQGKLSSKINDIMKWSNNVFASNGFLRMILTGSKGSMVNFIMICGMLNQQSLEGKRVPIMISCRTLPCFAPFDFGTRAGGFISDRFLTGLRPQEYFFHCMSGREGLIDTAVKTSKSGYLQRCVIKAMEAVMIHYDYTVRDSDGTIIQFKYGGDGIEVAKSPFLQGTQNIGLHDERLKAAPGLPVGCLAGQSIGEPATQMTLNTFHLAGHSATNVTLGIPRLTEILKNAGKTCRPVMAVPIRGNSHEEIEMNALQAIRNLTTIKLLEVIKSIHVDSDYLHFPSKNRSCWQYVIRVELEDLKDYDIEISLEKVLTSLKNTLVLFTNRVQYLLSFTLNSLRRYQLLPNTDDCLSEFIRVNYFEQLMAKDAGAAKRYKSHIWGVANSLKLKPCKIKRKHAAFFHKMTFSNSLLEYVLRIPTEKSPIRLNLIYILKNCLDAQIIKVVKGAKNPILVHQNTMTGAKYELSCEGNNLSLLLSLDSNKVDASKIETNDIVAIFNTFGVEAAYSKIIQQLTSVFASYGITVNYRHLSLIADYMTNDGDIKGFSRHGIARHTSPLMQISFETAMKFITRATERLAYDNLKTPSASLATGSRAFIGSSLCKLLYQLPKKKVKVKVPKPSDFVFRVS